MPVTPYILRRYQPAEEKQLWDQLYNTVHHVNNKDYSLAQCHAWAPDNYDMSKWKKRLSQTRSFVVE